MKKSSYKTNSWWNHRVMGALSPDRDIRTYEDKRQDAYLAKLEKSKNTPRKKSRTRKSS